MARVDVVLTRSSTSPHLRATDDVGHSLAEGLRALGHDSEVHESALGPGRNIVLGGHLLGPDQLARLPRETIFYNFEQIAPDSLLAPEGLDRFAGFEIWDYSRKNVARWIDHGFAARHVPLGWSPGLERIERAAEPEIDVLFYGSTNERRVAVLDRLEASGLRVERLYGVYGAERDAAIARAKVVVNVHYYDAGILEIVRLSYLFANGVPVVSEWSERLEMPEGYEVAARFAAYDGIVEAVVDLVADAPARQALADRARACVRAVPWAATLPTDLDTVHVAKEAPMPATAASPSPTPAPDGPREAVLVLGCHRSGTSMLTRLLTVGGFGITGPVIPAAADNPKGFWEDQRITILDDRLMAQVGNRWDSLTAPAILDWQADPVLVAIRDQLRQHLESGPHRRVVIKDPRITLLLPFWQELLTDMGWSIRTVFAIRDPAAVAESLRRRNGFAPVKGTLLWLSHTLFGDAFSRGLAPHVVDYDGLVADPVPHLTALHAALDMDVGLDTLTSSIADTVDADLDRSSNAPAERFRAAAMAQEARAAMLSGDTAVRDRLTGQYLDALELFVPMLDGLRSNAMAAIERFG